MKRIIAFILIFALCIPLLSPLEAYGATTIKLNKTKLELHEGESYTLKLKGASGTVKWSSSKKSVASVSSGGKVKAVKEGKATITATYNNKKYKCTVTVISGKKTDITLIAAAKFNTNIEEYAKNFSDNVPKFLDVKTYDDHIVITLYETDRLQFVKEMNNKLGEYVLSLLSDESLKGVFTDVKYDELFQNIILFTDKTTYKNNPLVGLSAALIFRVISDTVQGINLVDPAKRTCSITIIDNATGETIQ